MFCILQGVSVLKLKLDCLHTAAECSDGVETDLTCLDRLQQPDTASECTDTTTEGSWLVNCPVESCGAVDCRHGEAGGSERGCSLTASAPTSEEHPREHGLVPPEGWACADSERDYSKAAEEEEEEVAAAQEQPIVSTQSLSFSERTEGVQSEAAGKGLTVGIPPQAEETDRGEAAIQEREEAKKGEDRSEQEAEDGTAERREEDTDSESARLLTASGDTEASAMGQSPSSPSSEVSDGSDPETKERSGGEENVGKEDVKPTQDACDKLPLDEDKEESEGLTDTLSAPGDLPSPLIDCGDVIKEPEPVPCLLIEGLREGELVADINSLEQNQEMAGRDYAAEQEWALASEPGRQPGKELKPDAAEESSENSSVEERDGTGNVLTAGDTAADTRSSDCELSPDEMPTERRADPGTAHGLCSDDDGSFRSAGSSTTEIFQPARDSVEDSVQTQIADQPSEELGPEEPRDLQPDDTCEHFIAVDAGPSLEPGAQPESKHKLPTVEDQNPDLSIEDLSFDTPAAEAQGAETGETSSSDLNAGKELSAPESDLGVLTETERPVTEGSKGIDIAEEDVERTSEISDLPVVAAAEESGSEQPKRGNSEIRAEERPPDNQIALSCPQDDTVLSNSADLSSLEIEQLLPGSEAPTELHTEATDAVDGASESCGAEAQGG